MKFFINIALLICAFALQANAQIYFNNLYDYDRASIYNNAAGTSYEYNNGDYLITGQKYYSFSFGALFFIRTNANGDTVYTKRYPKANCSYYTGASNSLIKCSDGNLAQAGAYIDSSNTYPDALLIKLTEDGDTLWTKTYGGANFDNANIVCQTPDSGFVLMGVTQSYSNGPSSDFYLIKTDKNGIFQWQKVYGTTAAEDCVSGQITLDGGYILSGSKSINSTTSNFYIVKTDFMGNLQWQKSYTTSNGICFIKQLADSSYLLTGAQSIIGMGYQATILKVNKLGNFIWQKNYGGSTDDWFYSKPIILNDGSIIAGGQQMVGGKPFGLLIKTDSLGNQQWLRTYYANPSNANYVYDVKHTSDNGFILTGSGNVTGQDAWVVKVDSNGCEVANCNVGINEFKNENYKLQICPNPAKIEITVELSNSTITDYVIEIRNVLGELQKTEVQNSIINISQFASGIYFITAINKDGKIRVGEKFVKE
ncbi:MAG: hypothetical protein A3F72_02350 [Bacteroidetes bacterium RIFCSPLOWO2_12_FULL_35_15]|nr:MAG: hypothetical protein A3F72_02350 [Bacteroidetes bacterium RIFCSPLOWO2_12_FULL_35_15]